ncbi:unnamed protein product, partial [Ilex paraguariensis]
QGKQIKQEGANEDEGVDGQAVKQGKQIKQEGANKDEGVDGQAVKQEQHVIDKNQFVAYVKNYIKLLAPKLEPEKQKLFKNHIEGETKCLLSKLGDLQLYV